MKKSSCSFNMGKLIVNKRWCLIGMLDARMRINPCSPEGFSQTYFPKGGVVATPPLDYQY